MSVWYINKKDGASAVRRQGAVSQGSEIMGWEAGSQKARGQETVGEKGQAAEQRSDNQIV